MNHTLYELQCGLLLPDCHEVVIPGFSSHIRSLLQLQVT